MTMSKSEREFRALYPNARVVAEPARCTVYAGDYLCAESFTRARAFRLALTYVRERYIQPDPAERATCTGHPA
jgi:hypothetical protein